MTNPLNIWFNRNYATNYWIIKDIQNRHLDGYAISVFATHTDATSPVLQAADYVALEPSLSDEEYVDWCLQYCIQNNINVLVPVRKQLQIMEAASRFAEINVTLIAPPSRTVELFEDKAAAYKQAAENGISVPPWKIANSSQTIKDAYHKLQQELPENTKIVMKPVTGVGGEGFYIIGDKHLTAKGLLEWGKLYVSLEELISAYEVSENTGELVPPVMLLPFLSEPEISVDCLASQESELLRMAPRVKVGARLTQFTLSHEKVTELTKKLVDVFKLTDVFNIQWRWWNGEPVLLEVNTRASGGLYSVLEYTGDNYVWDAIRMHYGEVLETEEPLRDGSYIPLTASIPAKLLPLLNA